MDKATFTFGEISSIQVVPGQVFFMHMDEVLTMDRLENLQKQWKKSFPNNRLIVIGPGCRLSVVQEVEKSG